MYWPYANARRVGAAPGAGGARATHVALARDATMWLALTPSALQVWSARPCEVLATLERTEHSVHEYGPNVRAEWRSDARAIVVQTARDMLLFYDVLSSSDVYAYGAEAAFVPAPQSLHTTFRPMAGEHFRTPSTLPMGAGVRVELRFRHALSVEPGITAMAAYEAYVLVGTRAPAAVQLVPWPDLEAETHPTVLLQDLPWLAHGAPLTQAVYSRAMAMLVWLTEQRAYVVGFEDAWDGACFWEGKAEEDAPVATAVNARFSLVALGLANGAIHLFEFQSPAEAPTPVARLTLPDALRSTDAYLDTGRVTSLAYSSDGHALFAGYERGWALWSPFGMLYFHSFRDDWDTAVRTFRDQFMFGVAGAFFGPGNTELFVVPGADAPDALAFVVPLVRSASTAQLMPDEAANALLVSDDSLFLYRGYELQDVSILSPENDAWRHIALPPAYLAAHWPIRYAALSSDARFLAVAGRRGLAHFSCASGRWKTFTHAAQEQSFAVRGGLLWFEHVLIAACDAEGEIQLRLYSRDTELANAHLLDLVKLSAPVVLCSLFDTSLLVYTADNSLYHYLITPTAEHIRLRLCGSISFEGIVGEPARVRALSWLLPPSQQALGDPAQDLSVVSLLFLIDAKLVLLRPMRTSDGGDDLAYDLQILHEQVETYWTNLQSRGPLHNSLWGFDGHALSVWPDVQALVAGEVLAPSAVLPLDAYPICILLARGVVFAAEGTATIRRTLDTASFRMRSKTIPFLHALLRVYLGKERLEEALEIAAPYRTLAYFGHNLELLLHDLLEEEADARPPLPAAERRLPLVLQFLDHFDNALQVVVRVARKTEAARWPTLFEAAGPPRELLQFCLEDGDYDTARHYLLIVHELEEAAVSTALTAAVLQALERETAWDALREVLSFVRSLDEDGARLEAALRALQPLLPTDSPLLVELKNAPPAMPKRALVATPRRPSSQPTRRESPDVGTLLPRAHALRQAARHASLTLSPSAVPVQHSNGRIVLAPGHGPRS